MERRREEREENEKNVKRDDHVSSKLSRERRVVTSAQGVAVEAREEREEGRDDHVSSKLSRERRIVTSARSSAVRGGHVRSKRSRGGREACSHRCVPCRKPSRIDADTGAGMERKAGQG